MRNLLQCVMIASACLSFAATGCTVKGTINQITDTTSNVTGTTSGAAWWNEDGQIKPDFKATAFVTFNQANLIQDLAAGRGEYLGSLSRLLGIPSEHQTAFFSAAQANYSQIVGQEPAGLLSFLRESSKPFLQ